MAWMRPGSDSPWVHKMLCQLCKNDKEKLCDAHIIPESFFRFMYPEGKIEGESLMMILENKDYIKRSRTGFYDKNILCVDCDNSLSDLDEYGKKILIDAKPVYVTGTNNQLLVLENIDIPKLKLFFLSVLWRYSISELTGLNNQKLPPKFENELLSMILSRNHGSLDDFSILVTRFDEIDQNNLRKFVQFPRRTRSASGINGKYIYFPNGYKILIKIDQRPQPIEYRPFTLVENKPLYIFSHEKFKESSEFKKLLKEISKNRK